MQSGQLLSSCQLPWVSLVPAGLSPLTEETALLIVQVIMGGVVDVKG